MNDQATIAADVTEQGLSGGIPEIPTARYRSDAFFDLELKHVWFRSWLFVGHVSELTEAGAYKLFNQLERSIIIVRGGDNQVRAFDNSCRSRAGKYLQAPHGVIEHLVDPSHRWTYDLEGRFISPAQDGAGRSGQPAQPDLASIACDVWRGLIFINFSAEPGSLDAFMAPFAVLYEDLDLDSLEVKTSKTYLLPGNWKTVRDNFLESYHVGVVHRASIGGAVDPVGNSQTCLENGHGHMVQPLRRKNQPLLAGETKQVFRISESQRFDDTIEGLFMFPNGSSSIDAVSISLNMIWPAGRSQSIISAMVLGAPGGDPTFWEETGKIQDMVIAEDLDVLPGVQRSIESGHLKTMVLKNGEKLIHGYNAELDRLIGAENLAPEWRIDEQAHA